MHGSSDRNSQRPVMAPYAAQPAIYCLTVVQELMDAASVAVQFCYLYAGCSEKAL